MRVVIFLPNKWNKKKKIRRRMTQFDLPIGKSFIVMRSASNIVRKIVWMKHIVEWRMTVWGRVWNMNAFFLHNNQLNEWTQWLIAFSQHKTLCNLQHSVDFFSFVSLLTNKLGKKVKKQKKLNNKEELVRFYCCLINCRFQFVVDCHSQTI